MDEERPDRPLTFLGGALWTLAAVLVAQLVLSVIEGAHPGASKDLVSLTTCQILAQSIIVFAIMRLHEPDGSIRALFATKRPSILSLPLAALVGGGLAAPATLVSELVEKRWPVGEEDKAIVEKIYAFDTPGRQAMVLISMVIVMPLFDELFFRGVIFSALRKKGRLDLVIFATAAYDALLGGNLRAAPSLLTLLVAVGWVRARTESVWPAVVARVSFFAVLVGPEILGKPGIPVTAPWIAGALATSAIALVAIGGLTRRSPVEA